MDLASITGILSGLCLIIVAIFLKGDLTNFLNIPGLMIVLGGTMASTLLTFSLRDVAKAFQAALFVLYERNIDSNEMVKTMIKLSNISRRQGLVALGHIRTNHPILKKGCNLIADCAKEEIVNYPPPQGGEFHLPQR
jgi:chemotaxis protein MotA